ncbi:stalk domain-containing protein [Paenibacillaceae bacterium WGS1546]|uniref:stalk domain-containing protein n=1 Tax=Cohnella sp. WGS1546 TaxID=3366810 RepID=UPI00372D35A2
MIKKFSLFALGFMMVFALFNLGMAQAEELPYKYTVSESLGSEKATVSLYNFETMKAEKHELEFTVVSDGATLNFTSSYDQWANVSMYVEKDGVYKGEPVYWKTDEANTTDQVLAQYITFSYQPNSFYAMNIGDGGSVREVYFKVQGGQSEPATETDNQSSVMTELNLVNKDSGFKLSLPNFVKVQQVKGIHENVGSFDVSAVLLEAPELVVGNRVLLFELVTTNPDAYSAHIKLSYFGEGLFSHVETEFVDGKIPFYATVKLGHFDKTLIVNDMLSLMIDVYDKDGNYVMDINNVNLVFTGHNRYELVDHESTAPSQPVPAKPTSSNVLVNGKETSFQAYNINGNNYFKLRDLAMAVNGSEKQFEVSWDAEKNAINLISASPYTPVGGEMAVSDQPKTTTGKLTTSKIYKDGQEVQLTAYNIGGNNYFKLRDIAQAFNIGVTWDGAAQTIAIDTTIDYIPE